MDIVQFVVSILLYLFLFFGISFIINMLLRTTWVPGAIIYPLVVISIVSQQSLLAYITQPVQSLHGLAMEFAKLYLVDYIILLAGLVGIILSGITIQTLRARGYRMF